MHICKKCHCKANAGKGYKQKQTKKQQVQQTKYSTAKSDPVLIEINQQIATLEKKKKKYISTNRRLPITWVRAIIDQI
jgi:DNA integrity scanning protein DisA with diadenylate cyclase activity